jgi:hypothetical protein
MIGTHLKALYKFQRYLGGWAVTAIPITPSLLSPTTMSNDFELNHACDDVGKHEIHHPSYHPIGLKY